MTRTTRKLFISGSNNSGSCVYQRTALGRDVPTGVGLIGPVAPWLALIMTIMTFDPDRLLSRSSLPGDARRVRVAFSGGLDSSVLLHALSRLHAVGALPDLVAVHVNHGLQSIAGQWVSHCAAQSAALGVEFRSVRVQIDPMDPAGPEGAARNARYAALQGDMGPGAVLATAHHLDDQAETFLMRALRGSGPRGLAAMRDLQPFGPGWLWRPLLSYRREELKDYAQTHGLTWIEDPHNADLRYERAVIRQHVFPVLMRRWPAVSGSLARSAALSAEADDLLKELAAQDQQACQADGGLSCSALRRLSPSRRRNLLRACISATTLTTPPHGVMMRLDDLLQAKADATPCLAWPGGEMRRYRDVLFLLSPSPAAPVGWSASWDGAAPLVLPAGCGELTLDAPSTTKLQVKIAEGGEKLAMHAGGPRQPLKNLFQQSGIPPWQRRRTPLVYVNGRLRWAGGLPSPTDAEEFLAGLSWRKP